MTTTTGLSDTERPVLHHFAYITRRPEQIAAELAMPTSTVRGILHRCCNFEVPRALRLLIETEPEPEAPLAPATPAEKTTATVDEMVEIGVTYRQLDYWTRAGYLQVLGDAAPGIGVKRVWPVEELDIAALMLRLVDAGLDLEIAARVARDGQHQLGPGIHLVVEPIPAGAPPPVRPVRLKISNGQRCADKQQHTPGQPTRHPAWAQWAEKMARTHTQTRCPTCRQWAIWVPKETAP